MKQKGRPIGRHGRRIQMKGKARWRYILFLMKPLWRKGKGYLFVGLFVTVIINPISQLLMALLPKEAIDAVARQEPTGVILRIVGLFTLGLVLLSVLQAVFTLFNEIISTRLNYDLISEVYKRALYTDFRYFDDPEYFTQFSFAQQRYPAQVMQVAMILHSLLGNVATILTMGTLAFQAGPVLLLITLAFVAAQFVLSLPRIKAEAKLGYDATALARPLNYTSRIMQQKENMADLRASRAGETVLKRHGEAIRRVVDYWRMYSIRLLKYNLPSGILSPLQTSVILLYVILFVIDGDLTKIGLYASLTAATAALSAALQNTASLMGNVATALVNSEYVARFFETRSEIEPSELGGAPTPRGPLSLELRDVAFRYPESPFALEHFDLTVKPGQRVALVGENGAGKSTLMKLLLRLYDAESGEILLNGQDIKSYDVHALRLQIGMAFQDVRILSLSLRDNMTVYGEASDEAIETVLREFGLEKLLDRAPHGLDTLVSREFAEDGVVLSGGEAQRLALARLFLKDFGLLLLDEPSSALDPLAEAKLMELLMARTDGVTTLMVAHRLSTVRDFDVIHYVENGAIVESGTHAELMARSGKYAAMFTRQAEKYQEEGRVLSTQ